MWYFHFSSLRTQLCWNARTAKMDQFHDLEKQPTVLTKHLNRRLSVQNFGLSKTWNKKVSDLEKEKTSHGSKMDGEIARILQYRNSLTESTGKLSQTEQLILPSIVDNSHRKVSFNSIVDHALHHDKDSKGSHNSKLKNNRNRVDSFTKETTSSENKRIGRRKSSFSLLELQHFIALQSANEENPSTIVEDDTDSEIEKTNHLWLEEGEVLPIRLPPLAHVWKLPKIYSQETKKLEARNFERDDEFIDKSLGKDADYSDIKYCRYLRVPSYNQRKRSRTLSK